MIEVKLERDHEVNVDKLPNQCPYCHSKIRAVRSGYNFSHSDLELIFTCPTDDCLKTFIGYYKHSYGTNFNFLNCNVGVAEEINFSNEIKNISPAFVQIYNEAYFTEQHNLMEICGVGYRKSLEFLIKDYLIWKNPEKENDIKRKFLKSCIDEDVKDEKVKQVALRATWLGNDETHYVRIWETKSLNDLKNLINLTLHWILMEELTNTILVEMPEKTKK